MFFGIDMALTRWSSGFCMQKIALPSLKQKMFNDPFVVNLLNLSLDTIQMIMTLSTSSLILALLLSNSSLCTAAPPLKRGGCTQAKRQDSVQSKTISSSFRIPTRKTQRFDNHMQFNHPRRFEYANSSNLITVPRKPCLLPPLCSTSKNLHFCLLNTRSVRNKALLIMISIYLR